VLRAIDTPYKGHLFRSRLEARWAVFFTLMGIDWEYEVEGFDLDGVWYLPDFRLKTPQGADFWVEVKPATTKKDAKFQLFLNEVGSRAQLVSGTPLQWLDTHMLCPRCGLFYPHSHFDEFAGFDRGKPEVSIYCYWCDMETPSGGGHTWVKGGVLNATYYPHKGDIITDGMCFSSLASCVREAATQAQQKRFEHGERG
jgi:hypothetical protein